MHDARGSGVILSTSSMVSLYGQPSGIAYPASKFAVNGLTVSLARELGPKGIRVNAVAPGITETDMMKAVPKSVIEPMIAQIPLRRLGQPEDIANAFVFLASDEASYITGVVLSVDGRKEVHDFMRPFPKGAGSYDLILPKFQKFAESRNQDKYYVRGTFTRHNLDFSKDVLHLADLGFKQISVEPVVAPDEAEYSLREEDLPIIFEEYDKLAREMIVREKEGRGFNFSIL